MKGQTNMSNKWVSLLLSEIEIDMKFIDIKELRQIVTEVYWTPSPFTTDELLELLDRLEEAEGELETERMRLAACGIAALGYFEGCAKKYTSTSLDDVLNLSKRLEAAEKERDELHAKITEVERQAHEIERLRYLVSKTYYIHPETGNLHQVLMDNLLADVAEDVLESLK